VSWIRSFHALNSLRLSRREDRSLPINGGQIVAVWPSWFLKFVIEVA